MWPTFNILWLADLVNRECRLTVVYSVSRWVVGRSVVRLPGPWSLHRRQYRGFFFCGSQNKAVRVINDVPLMESITPHYTSLGLLKFPDIVKLNTCMLFYDYFHHEKFPNMPVSLVSKLHNYSTHSTSSNQAAIPLFRTNLRRFCPSTIGSFFWNDIPQSIRDKPYKKMFRKALFRCYLAQY